VQAITEDTLKKANIIGMEDYAKLIPSMSYVNYTPGTGKVYFRGIADDNGTFIAEESSALYLNEQPVTQSGMAVDVRMIDVARIEALAGPQGTLYGSSAQSGAIRIITNKPDTSEFSALGDVTLKTMGEGGSSYDFSGVINVPITDNFAIRAVGFTAEDGGFVDVVDRNSARFGIVNNSTFNPSAVREDVNTFNSSGGRIAGQWDMDDGYYLVELATQQNSADGYSYFDRLRLDQSNCNHRRCFVVLRVQLGNSHHPYPTVRLNDHRLI
jgi:outer membrane receptor protein involved in Fe transport